MGEEKEKIMDYGLTDEQELLVESLKEYADRYFDDESVRQMYENHQVTAEAQDAYRDAGFPLWVFLKRSVASPRITSPWAS